MQQPTKRQIFEQSCPSCQTAFLLLTDSLTSDSPLSIAAVESSEPGEKEIYRPLMNEGTWGL